MDSTKFQQQSIKKRGYQPVLKVKVKLSLCFNWAPRHKDVLGKQRYRSTQSLTSALHGGEWSASRLGRFIPGTAHGTHWIGGWVGPRAGLDTVSKRKIPSPPPNSNLDHLTTQPVVSHYTYRATPALSTCINNKKYEPVWLIYRA
jgi:hypothetical protein